jgi:hypothetical protein
MRAARSFPWTSETSSRYGGTRVGQGVQAPQGAARLLLRRGGAPAAAFPAGCLPLRSRG